MQTKAVFKWLSILMIASLIFTTLHVTPALAAGRQAVVVKVVGDVYIKKAGGSRELLAYEQMTLNDGDHIRTAKNSSVIVQLADRDDEVTIDANTELYISDLRESKGKKSKFRVWSGSVMSKTKSMFGSDDEFEIDTPNAVMGVRGTHFFVFVDPFSGDTRISVFSGIVNSRSAHTDDGVDVYPSFEGFVFGQLDGDTPPPGVSFIDPDEISEMINEDVIAALLRNKEAIDAENDEIANNLSSTFSDFGFNEADLVRLQNNIDRLIGNIVRNTLESGRLSEEELDEIINRAGGGSLDDILNTPPLEDYESPTYQEQQERLNRLKEQRQREIAEREQQRREQAERNRDLLDRIQEDRERQQQENERAANDERESAQQRYMDQLSDEERERFEQRGREREEQRKRAEEEQRKREERAAQRTEQSASTPSTGSGGGGRGSRPATDHRLGSPIPIGSLTDNKVRFAGGIIVDLGNNDIPSGVTLTVTEASANDAESAGLQVAGRVLNFQFSNGYKPNQPVQLTLPMNSGVNADQTAIFHKEEEGKWMVEMTSTVEDGVAKASVTSFSTFGVFTADQTERPLVKNELKLVNPGEKIQFQPETAGSIIFYQEANSTQRKAYDPANPPVVSASSGFRADVYAVAPNRLPSDSLQVNYTAVTPSAEAVDGIGIVTLMFSSPVKLSDAENPNVSEKEIIIDGLPYSFTLFEDFNGDSWAIHPKTVQYGESEREIVIELESGTDLSSPYYVNFYYIDPDTEERYVLRTNNFGTGVQPTPVSYAKFSVGSPDDIITIDYDGLDVGLMLYNVPNVYGIQLHLLYDWYIGAYEVMSNPDGVFGHDQNGDWQDPIDFGSERIGWTYDEQLKKEYVYSIVNDAHLETQIDIEANEVIRVYFGLANDLPFAIAPDESDDEGYVYGSIELTKIIAIDRFGNETTLFVDLPSIPIRVHEMYLPMP